MKTSRGSIREAITVCRESGIYPLLSRQERKDAILYCSKIIRRIKEGGSRFGDAS
jgi:hypothetical protein